MKKFSCTKFLEIEPSRPPCYTEDLETNLQLKRSINVVKGKGQRYHCLSWSTMETVLGVSHRLSGRVTNLPPGRKILAPSSSLSPNNDPISSSKHIYNKTVIGDHALERHYYYQDNHLTDKTRVTLILINLSMRIQVLTLREFLILPKQIRNASQ